MTSNFYGNERVMMLDDTEIRRGVVIKCRYDMDPPTALVKFDDNEDLEKVPADKLVPEQIDRKSYDNPEKTIDSEEFREKTVNSGEFQKIAIRTIIENSDDDLNAMLFLSMFVSTLHKALFGIESDND